MKRWAIVLVTVTLCMVSLNITFATDEVNIYNESEIIYNGKIIMNFITKDTIDVESQEYGSPISNLEIELYYQTDVGIENVNGLSEFKNLNLVSNFDGAISIENIPYGIYEYKIINAPEGIEYDNEFHRIILTRLDSPKYQTIYLLRKLQLAPAEIETPEDDENVSVNNKEQEEVEEIVVDNEYNNQEKNYEYVPIVYKTSDVRTLPDEDVMENIIEQVSNKIQSENKHLDMIQIVKDVKLNDEIKLALPIDIKEVNKINQAVMDLPKNDNEKLKINIIKKEKIKDKKYKLYEEKKYNITNKIRNK